MTTGLHSPLPDEAAVNERLMRSATWASLSVAGVLVVTKAMAWAWTGSVSLLGSLVDSGVDALASAVTLLAVHASLRPPDFEHRFGHGKLEPLAGLGQALLIFGSVVGIVWKAVQRLREPEPLQEGLAGVAVMVFASALTVLLVRYQRRVIRATDSTAIGADSLHYKADLWMNLAVIVSILASSWFDWALVDPLLGLVVAALVGSSAWSIGSHAVQLLMDREFPDDERERIIALVVAHPEVRGLHDLRTRRSGTHRFIQFHMELDGDLPLRRAHFIGEAVASEIRAEFPGSDVIIHADPEDLPADGSVVERIPGE